VKLSGFNRGNIPSKMIDDIKTTKKTSVYFKWKLKFNAFEMSLEMEKISGKNKMSSK